MSNTWTTDSGNEFNSGSVWSISPTSGPVGPRYTRYERKGRYGIWYSHKFPIYLPFGALAADGSLDEASARRCCESWTTATGDQFRIDRSSLVGSTSTQAAQPPTGQKANAPMKLTLNRQSLIASIQKTIDALTAKDAERQAKNDANKVIATAVVNAALPTLAANYGFTGDDAVATFQKSPSFDQAVISAASHLGLTTGKVSPNYNIAAAKAQLDELNLVSTDTIDVEEDHRFFQFINHAQ